MAGNCWLGAGDGLIGWGRTAGQERKRLEGASIPDALG